MGADSVLLKKHEAFLSLMLGLNKGLEWVCSGGVCGFCTKKLVLLRKNWEVGT